jgi:hypothetical protein
MHLGAYHFDGESPTLLESYERLMESFPPDILDLHVCVTHERGITILDACPSAEVFRAFSTGPEFAEALRTAGLPAPRIDTIGEVHNAVLREAALS